MERKDELEAMFRKHGFDDFRWLDPATMVTGQWVRMRCLYSCPEYGHTATCPPNAPPVEQCERFFREYEACAVFRFHQAVANPEDRHDWTNAITTRLLALEKDVFLAGFYKAFLMPMDSCHFCSPCAGRLAACKRPYEARPTPDAMAIDVYATVRNLGYPIEVLKAYDEPMNRYAFLLVE